MKALVILVHPNIESSNINKRWKQELLKHTDKITIHELYKKYPNWEIDVEKEHQLLENHDYVFFQFPLYWYSYPALLKKWFDDVFTYGWAFGTGGDKLKGKNMGLAISVGDVLESYSHSSPLGVTLDDVMTPFKASLRYTGAKVLPFFAIYGVPFHITTEEMDISAQRYVNYIFSYMNELKTA